MNCPWLLHDLENCNENFWSKYFPLRLRCEYIQPHSRKTKNRWSLWWFTFSFLPFWHPTGIFHSGQNNLAEDLPGCIFPQKKTCLLSGLISPEFLNCTWAEPEPLHRNISVLSSDRESNLTEFYRKPASKDEFVAGTSKLMEKKVIIVRESSIWNS